MPSSCGSPLDGTRHAQGPTSSLRRRSRSSCGPPDSCPRHDDARCRRLLASRDRSLDSVDLDKETVMDITTTTHVGSASSPGRWPPSARWSVSSRARTGDQSHPGDWEYGGPSAAWAGPAMAAVLRPLLDWSDPWTVYSPTARSGRPSASRSSLAAWLVYRRRRPRGLEQSAVAGPPRRLRAHDGLGRSATTSRRMDGLHVPRRRLRDARHGGGRSRCSASSCCATGSARGSPPWAAHRLLPAALRASRKSRRWAAPCCR